MGTPTWGAASPTPGAASMVARIWLMSSVSSLVPRSAGLTGSARRRTTRAPPSTKGSRPGSLVLTALPYRLSTTTGGAETTACCLPPPGPAGSNKPVRIRWPAAAPLRHGTSRHQSLGRDYRWLWAAYAVSAYGSGLGFGAFPLIAVLVLHAPPAEVSALSAGGPAGGGVVALPLGPWVEFRRKRSTMIAMDLARFAAMMTIPVAYAFGRLSFAQLLTVSA